MKCEVCLELLEEYLDGELAAEDHEQVDAHLVACSECSESFAALNAEQEAAIQDVLLPALVNKLSHPVIVHLRHAARNGEPSEVIEELRKMIRID